MGEGEEARAGERGGGNDGGAHGGGVMYRAVRMSGTHLGAQPGLPQFLDGDLRVVVVVERLVALLVARIVFELFAQKLWAEGYNKYIYSRRKSLNIFSIQLQIHNR